MDELIGMVVAFFGFWGAWLGLLVAAVVTWPLSAALWGEFSFGLFWGLSIPLVIGGVYLQHVTEREA